MAIKIDGSSGTDIISAADGSLTIEGVVSTDKLVAKTEDWITHTGDTNTRMGFPATDVFAVETAGTERLRIDSSGRLLVGLTASIQNTAYLQLKGANTSDISLYWPADAATAGSHISWRTDGGGAATETARIFCGQSTTGADGGYMTFFTHNGTSMGERLRITSAGNVSIHSGAYGGGGTAPQLYVVGTGGRQVKIHNTNAGTSSIQLSNATTGQGEDSGFQLAQLGGGDFYFDHQLQAKDVVFRTKPSGGSLTEKLRITSDGLIGVNNTAPEGAGIDVLNTRTTAYSETSDQRSSAHIVARNSSDSSGRFASISLVNGGGTQAEGSINLVQTGNYTGDLTFKLRTGSGSSDWRERLRIYSSGDVYVPGNFYGGNGGRKNWFDNGSFDCREGRRVNTSMDYGNHHAYGWVTDRFMSRNAVQWSRSTNVPTGKGFHSSTSTNGAGGILMQAVELPDYGDMGVFTPGSYWCVSFWSTAACNPSTSAFSYDLGSTKTDIPIVGSGGYATTGETAAGTSSGTFSRYYRVYGPMPSSIISGATGAYWTWGFSQQGYTTGFQLERVPTSTSKPTPYEHVHPAVTTARCRRYAWQFKNARLIGGYKRHDGQCSWQMQHPVPGTHMPSGSNQSVDPYGVHLHDAGMFTNFQSSLQNPGVTSVGRYEYDFRSGYFVMEAQSNWSSTHAFIPSWESAELEFQHGFF